MKATTEAMIKATAKKAVLDRFEVRPTRQREWHLLILVAFFFAGVGCGLFLTSAFFDFTYGFVLSLAVIGLCMGIPHLIYLGHPLRFWRIFTSWSALKTSWLTRGMWGWVVFGIFGLLSLLASGGWVPWTSESIAGRVILGIASAAAFFGIIYVGFVMAQSPSIPFWHTPMLPAVFMLYGLVGGIDLTFISLAALGQTYAINIELLESVQIAMLISIGIFIWAYLGLMSTSRVGAKESVRILTRGELSPIFWGVVIVVGLVIPLTAVLYASFIGLPMLITGIVGLLALVGCLYFKYCTLRVGVYSPIY